MLEEVMEYLDLSPGATFADGTLGLAGHALAAVAHIQPRGRLVACDWDAQMLAIARERLSEAGVEVHLKRCDYRDLPLHARESVGPQSLDGVLLDLGLNNAQIEDPERGISFRSEAPLDMRMDREKGEPASAWLNRATAAEIERVLKEFGDERWARRIAQVIVDRRKLNPLRTTADLVNCIEAAVPPAMRDKRLHPATRSFQAIRIWINEELDGLEEAITEIAHELAPNGRMVVLSYHSGEDRAVKHAFRALAQSGEYEELTRKPLVPSDTEIARNPKSRSAKLRALRKTS